ncbi:hypothetical protein BGX34_003225 [Mortierella sp. NVP85]|nr:hypothetical protein BGX34_003225 [Mortierella sp. NVP85]
MTSLPQKHTLSTRWWAKALVSVAVLATSTQAACVSLANSKACPSFSKFYVDSGILSALAEFGIKMAPFSNVAEFDKAAFNATGFFTSSDCTGYSGKIRIPYQNTLLCTIAVQEELTWSNCGDKQPATTSNMCDTSCKLYQDGLAAMIQKTCPKASDALKGLADLTKICSRKDPKSWMGLHDNSKSCIDSQKNEIGTCGLGSLEDKCRLCQTNINATAVDCCKNAVVECQNTTVPIVSPTPSAGVAVTSSLHGLTQSATPSPTNDNAQQPPTTTKTTLSSGAIGGIVGGAVAGIVLFAFVLFMCMRRPSKANEAHGLSRQISNTSGRYNISAPKLQEEGYMSASTAPIPMTTLPPMPEPTSLGLGSAFASAGTDAGTAAGAGVGVGGAGIVGGVGFAAGLAAGALAGQEAPGKQSYCQALYPYQASMADELDLTQGDIINVLRVYDDGWAAGVNLNTSKEGVFPVVCVMFVDESALDDDFEEVNMHSMTPMTLREEDQEGRHSPSGRNSPRSSLPSRSSSPVHLPRRNSSILRENAAIASGTSPMTSSPLASGSGSQGAAARLGLAAGPSTGAGAAPVRDTMMTDTSSMGW